MGPPSYVQSVVDRSVVMWRMTMWHSSDDLMERVSGSCARNIGSRILSVVRVPWTRGVSSLSSDKLQSRLLRPSPAQPNQVSWVYFHAFCPRTNTDKKWFETFDRLLIEVKSKRLGIQATQQRASDSVFPLPDGFVIVLHAYVSATPSPYCAGLPCFRYHSIPNTVQICAA